MCDAATRTSGVTGRTSAPGSGATAALVGGWGRRRWWEWRWAAGRWHGRPSATEPREGAWTRPSRKETRKTSRLPVEASGASCVSVEGFLPELAELNVA